MLSSYRDPSVFNGAQNHVYSAQVPVFAQQGQSFSSTVKSCLRGVNDSVSSPEVGADAKGRRLFESCVHGRKDGRGRRLHADS